MPIRFLDMFAGIGGFRSGLERLGGFQCVGYCEIDKYAKQAYDAMYPTKGEIYFADARTIDPIALPDIDLICGGFPCQSFSIAGLRRGFQDDTRGTLFLRSHELPPLKDHLFCCLKMFPDCCRMTKAGLLRPSSVRWMSWGTMSHGKSLTARISVSPNPESVCILSDILESDVAEKYYLSQTQMQRLLSNSLEAQRAIVSTRTRESALLSQAMQEASAEKPDSTM